MITLAAMFLAAAMVPTPTPAPQDDREAAIPALRGYHAALTAGQPDKVAELLGPSYFMAGERPAKGAERLSAHLFLAGERLRSWPKNYLSQAGAPQNQFAVVAASIRGDAAVVVTRDTGRNAFRTWSDEETAWFLGRVNGVWRIVGMIIRDIQLPQ